MSPSAISKNSTRPRLTVLRVALFLILFHLMSSTSNSLPRVAAQSQHQEQQRATAHILLYTATAGFRHDSIPTAIQALQNQSREHGGRFSVRFDSTEDSGRFRDDVLDGYDAVMFVSTTGEVLDASGKTAFQNYLNKGGNFIGVHSASDTLRNDSWYGNEIGAYFDYHPPLQNATVNVLDSSHPSTNMLPAQWHVQDEMYNLDSDPRDVGAIVILSADESSYVDDGPGNSAQGSPHPTAWYQERGAGVEGDDGFAGRSFYTSLGHLNETWRDDLFIAHVMGGVTWALESGTTRAFNSSGLVGNGDTTDFEPSEPSTTSGSGSESTSTSASDDTSSSLRTTPMSLTILVLAIGIGVMLSLL